jgi:predicted metal-dependent hydrolase
MLEPLSTIVGLARLKRSHRKTLAISVLPDGTLELTAPMEARDDMILAKVAKRAAWIRTQRRAFKEMNAVRPPPRYVSGATHRYLGRQYRLKLATGSAPSVALRGGYLHVTLPVISESEVKKSLTQWYRSHAREQFTQRLAQWNDWCKARRLPAPRLRLLTMSKRWGSAQSDGTICLNPELVRAPSACVDYVITHEICHLKHPHHGPAFWRLLEQWCPLWRSLKQRLEAGEGW